MQYPMNEVRISSYWGNRTYTMNGKKVSGFHYGLDIAGVHDVFSVDDGEVISRGTNGGSAGWYIVIKHPHNFLSVYFHLQRFDVNVGAKVKKGQLIGQSGSTGGVTGPHKHIEIWVNVPDNYIYSISTHVRDRKKYARNPINYLMLEKHQTSTFNIRKVLDYTAENIKGTLIVSNPSVRQRIEPSTRYNETVRGNIPLGEYKVSKCVKMSDYTWVEVNGLWVALIKGATELIPEVSEAEKALQNKLDIVTKENEELKQQVDCLQGEIKRYTPMTYYIKE